MYSLNPPINFFIWARHQKWLRYLHWELQWDVFWTLPKEMSTSGPYGTRFENGGRRIIIMSKNWQGDIIWVMILLMRWYDKKPSLFINNLLQGIIFFSFFFFWWFWTGLWVRMSESKVRSWFLRFGGCLLIYPILPAALFEQFPSRSPGLCMFLSFSFIFFFPEHFWSQHF